MGFLFKDMLEKRFRGLAKWISVLNDVDESEVQRIITVSLEEETIENHSHVHWYSYTARKPNNESGPNKSGGSASNPFTTPATSQRNVTSSSLQI
jgi:hypothetical protein